MKTFAQHLQELKTRLAMCLLAVGAGSLLGFFIYKPVEAILQKPLNQTLYYTNPAGGLTFVMQICLGIGVLVALPLLLYQLLQFARPAIRPIKTRSIVWLLITTSILSVLALIYAYYVSLPAALHFLITFNGGNVKALINISDYMKFLFAYLIGTVLAFQLPLVMFFANRIRRFPPGGLTNLQRPAIIGAVVFAGVVTPTVDPINQMLVALPIIALFEVGAVAVVISNRINKPLPHFEIKMPAKLVPLVVPLDEAPAFSMPVSAATISPQPVATRQITRPRPVRRRIVMDVLPSMG